MATPEPTKGAPPSPERIGRLLMISERRVQQLAKAGWIPRPYTVAGAVQGYIKFLQDEQRQNSVTVGRAEIERERARKLKRENLVAEHQLVPTEDAVAAIDAIVGPIKADLAGVAPRVSDNLALRRRIEDEIDSVLAAIANRLRQAGADLLAGRDALAAKPADDADTMGEEEPELSAIGGQAGATRA